MVVMCVINHTARLDQPITVCVAVILWLTFVVKMNVCFVHSHAGLDWAGLGSAWLGLAV